MSEVSGNPQLIFEKDIQSARSNSASLFLKFARAINYIIKGEITPLGTIETSLLPEAQFQKLRSNAWVKIKAQDITNTDLGQFYISEGIGSGTITLPDMRGMHQVFTNDGRSDGFQHIQNPVLGQQITGQIKAHNHFVARDVTESNLLTASNHLSFKGVIKSGEELSTEYNLKGQNSQPNVGITSTTGQSQNTVNAVGFNIYIKVWNNPQ